MTRSSAMATLGAIAEAQWGLVTTRQAVQNNVSYPEMTRLTKDGVLNRVAYGVYRVAGSPVTPLTELRAAWLLLEPETEADLRDVSAGVVSHGSAAFVYGVGDFTGEVHEFTCEKRKRSGRPEVRIHTRPVDPETVVWIEQLPVTSTARLVSDLLEDHHDGQHMAHVLADSLDRSLSTPAELAAAVSPHASAYGVTPATAFLDHLISLVRPSSPGNSHRNDLVVSKAIPSQDP
jgi:predicted transcriptional regulator of viral defense system